jgi:hypothetical protein
MVGIAALPPQVLLQCCDLHHAPKGISRLP